MDIVELLAGGTSLRHSLTRNICDRIRSLIVSGKLKPGVQLPSEVELADAMGVSRNTIRDALNTLQQEGTILRRHGVGTFVTEQLLLPNRLDVNLSVTELIRSCGMEPAVGHIQVRILDGDDYWCKILQLTSETRLVELARVRLADSKPVVFSLDVFPVEYLENSRGKASLETLPSLLRKELSIYAVMEDYCGIDIRHGIVTLRPAQADRMIAEQLQVDEGDLLMFLEQVDQDASGRTVMASQEYHVSDVYTFTVHRKR